MEGKNILNPNPLVKFLDKPQKEFTKADIIRYIIKNEIEMINLRYVGADGRLKTLNFIINNHYVVGMTLPSHMPTLKKKIFSFSGEHNLVLQSNSHQAFFSL